MAKQPRSNSAARRPLKKTAGRSAAPDDVLWTTPELGKRSHAELAPRVTDRPPAPLLAPPVPINPIVHPVAVCRWCGERFYLAHARPPQWLCLTPACADRQVAAAIPRIVPPALEGIPDEGSPWLFLPLPLNVDLMESPYKRTLVAGAAGASKSYGARWSAYAFCLKHPGARVLLLRESFPALHSNHTQYMAAESMLLQTYAGQGTVRFFGGNYKSCAFENGAVISFAYCSTEADVPKLIGSDHDLIILEEAVNQTEKAIAEIPARDRGSPTARALGAIDGRTWLLSNPGGQGMLALMDFYITRTPDPVEYPQYNPEIHGYIRATLDDNPYLAPNYAETNLSGLSADRYQQLRYGSWEVFVGQFFDFNAAQHVRALPGY